jgi:FkbM family methyltransferase
MAEAKITYAQNREDIILEGMLVHVKKGFYVDVGANDPDTDSVTKRFYLKGWSGINIEPNRFLYERLVQERTRDRNLCVGVGAKNATASFREYPAGNGLSTFSNFMKKENTQNDSAQKYLDYEVEIKTLATIFAEQKVKTIDFLKIDVEGYEWEVIKGNDWNTYRPKVVCIEANHGKNLQDWQAFLVKQGYLRVFFDGLNEYYRDGQLSDWPAFSYPEAVLAMSPVSYETYETQMNLKTSITKQERELNLARIHIRHLWKLMDEKQQQINILNEEIIQMKRLKRATRIFLKSIDTAIINRINRLNVSPVIEVRLGQQAELSLEDDTETALLKQVQQFDLQEGYVRHIKNPQKDTILYRVTMGVYKGGRKAVKYLLKGLRKIVRIVRK